VAIAGAASASFSMSAKNNAHVSKANDSGTPVAIGCAPDHALVGDICSSHFWISSKTAFFSDSSTLSSGAPKDAFCHSV
jgi:hypothetical protein